MKTLKEALKIAIAVQGKGDREFNNHCEIRNNQLRATDGVLSFGCGIEENFDMKPNSKLLLTALESCGDNTVFNHVKESELVVKSGKYSAKIPCWCDDLPVQNIDSSLNPVDPNIVTALSSLCSIAELSGKNEFSVVWCNNDAGYATNGIMLMAREISLNGMEFGAPSALLKRVLTHSAKLTHVGSSEDALSFIFADTTWFKIPKSEFSSPQFSDILLEKRNWVESNHELQAAINSVGPFCETFVKMSEDGVYSVPGVSGADSAYRFKTEINPCMLNAALLNIALKHATHYDFNSSEKMAYFYGPGREIVLCKAKM